MRSDDRTAGDTASPLRLTIGAFMALVAFDAMMGGSIAALLQVEGWTPLDQRINNVYQANYAMVVIATLGWLYFFKKLKRPVLALVLLFVCYVEDTLFYIAVAIANPLIYILTKGATYHPHGGGLFPDSISGWTGWVGRMVAGQNVSFEIYWVFALNILAIVAAWLILRNGKT